MSRSNHMLAEVKLRRFKAAFQPRPIPLRGFNVIIGRNGSGKSTLLEALQWLDTTMRRDAREACDRYHGIGDLVNLRSQSLDFELEMSWRRESLDATGFRYRVTAEEDANGTARIAVEELVSLRPRSDGRWRKHKTFIQTTEAGERWVGVNGNATALTMKETDRLALAWIENIQDKGGGESPRFLGDFWQRAVFLRLSPNRLTEGSPATRRSFEPLLDEEGQTLPALLNELDDARRKALVDAISDILPGIRDVAVSKAEFGRDTRVHYNLLEEMPYRGRAGKKEFPIPAWMLSEGTRRITAILALLERDPPPSLLCIEEIENGLDPWTVRLVLQHLQDAVERGTQVILSTHSPWVLDDVPMDSILFVRRRHGDTQYEHFASLPEVQEFADSVPAGTRYVQLSGGE